MSEATSQDELLERVERVIPGACLGMMWLPPEIRPVMRRGVGSRVYDHAGNEYIDFMLGSGPLLLGHNHPRVIQAAREQLEQGSTYFALSEPAIQLAETIVDAVPCGEAIRFQTTGSEATYSAIRLARAYTARNKVLKFEGGWHGGHDLGQLSAAPRDPAPLPHAEPDCDGISELAAQEVLVAPFNDPERTREIIRSHSGELAAVIVEPLQRAIRPEPGFLEAVRAETERYGIVLIFDEIVTGFRLAWGGAQERYGVLPDMACYGKAMAGGFPLSAVVGRRDILELANPKRKGIDPYCFLSGTFTGNPLAAAAGLATLGVLREPGVYERLHEAASILSEGIANIGDRAGVPLQVLGDGPVLQLFFCQEPIRCWRDGLKSDRALAMRLGRQLIRRYVYLTPGGKIYISLAHSNQDLEDALERIEDALRAAI